MKENQPKKGSGAERASEWVDPSQVYTLTPWRLLNRYG